MTQIHTNISIKETFVVQCFLTVYFKTTFSSNLPSRVNVDNQTLLSGVIVLIYSGKVVKKSQN